MTPTDSLDALATVLLPGDDRWPAAGELDVGAAVLTLAQQRPDTRDVVAHYTGTPIDLSRDAVAAVAAYERANPSAFGTLCALVYEAYYAHPRTQDILAERTGRRPGPAQPVGYPRVFELERSPDVSAVVRRGVVWRVDGTQMAAAVRAAQQREPTRTWTEEEISEWRR